MAGFRTKYEPPELEEALVAAEGMTDDLEQQHEIAAALMGVAPEAVRAYRENRKRRPAPAPQAPARFSLGASRSMAPRPAPEVVVIKRRPRAAA